MIPTRRLPAALLAVGLVVLPMGTWGAGVWVLGNVAVLVAVVVDVVLAVSPRRMEVQREVDPVLVIDTDARLRWVVTNPTRRRARVHLADALPESLRAVDRRARLVVPAGARVHADGTVRPARRGVHGKIALKIAFANPITSATEPATSMSCVPGSPS